MAMNKLKWAGGAVLAAALLTGVGVGRWSAEAYEPNGQAKGAKKAAPLPPTVNDPPSPSRDPLVGDPDRIPPQTPPVVSSPPTATRGRIPPPEAYTLPPPSLPAPGTGRTFVVSRPVGTWTRDVAEENVTIRLTVKFEEDRLTIRAVETSGRESTETVLDADYSITRDSVAFGVITGYDTTSREAGEDEYTDQPFSFRFRVDNGVLTVKDLRMPGAKGGAGGLMELMAGRYATEGAGEKAPAVAKPKPVAPRRTSNNGALPYLPPPAVGVPVQGGPPVPPSSYMPPAY